MDAGGAREPAHEHRARPRACAAAALRYRRLPARPPYDNRPAPAARAFALPVHGLSVIDSAGTLLARDGDVEIRTPYDDCMLIMPTRRPRPGETAVRLGRLVG